MSRKEMQENPPFTVTHRASMNLYEVYISEEIGAPSDYVQLISFIRRCTALDEIHFYINSPGGRLDAGFQLLNAIEECEAQTTMIADGQVFSMAAFLLFSGDTMEIRDNAMLMIHNYSGGQIGKGGDLFNQSEAFNEQVRFMMNKYFTGFLTADEMQDILHGRDMYFSPEDIKKRIDSSLRFNQVISDISDMNGKNVNTNDLPSMEEQNEDVDKKPTKKKSPVKKKAPTKKKTPRKKA